VSSSSPSRVRRAGARSASCPRPEACPLLVKSPASAGFFILAGGSCDGDSHTGRRDAACSGLKLPLAGSVVAPIAPGADSQLAGLRHRSRHHFVAKAPRLDDQTRRRGRTWVLPRMGGTQAASGSSESHAVSRHCNGRSGSCRPPWHGPPAPCRRQPGPCTTAGAGAAVDRMAAPSHRLRGECRIQQLAITRSPPARARRWRP